MPATCLTLTSKVGRIINYLKQIDQYDNTLIFLMIGDNGGSKEGTYTGSVGLSGAGEKPRAKTLNYCLASMTRSALNLPALIIRWDGRRRQIRPSGIGKVMQTPKGATHNPMVIHYPKGLKEKGTVRTQYSHVIDILPTTVEITGVKVPQVINGYPQLPIQGTSLVYALSDPNAPTKHTVQYYELHGGRSIYKDGWKAEVYHPRNFSRDTTTTDINFVPTLKKTDGSSII